jgi:RimJ/RimL family protein N-acetyltransferase
LSAPREPFNGIEMTTERLILRPVDPTSFAVQTFHWTKDRQALSDLMLRADGWTRWRWWRQLRKMSRKNRSCHGIWLKAGGPPIGFHMALFTPATRDVTTGIFIADTLWRGKGVAAETKTALIDDFFGREGANRITSWVNARNFASIHMSLRLGFAREAVLRQSALLLDGSLTDLLAFGLLRSEWLARRQADSVEPAGEPHR